MVTQQTDQGSLQILEEHLQRSSPLKMFRYVRQLYVLCVFIIAVSSSVQIVSSSSEFESEINWPIAIDEFDQNLINLVRQQKYKSTVPILNETNAYRHMPSPDDASIDAIIEKWEGMERDFRNGEKRNTCLNPPPNLVITRGEIHGQEHDSTDSNYDI